MIRITDIKCSLETDNDGLNKKISKKLRLDPSDIIGFTVKRKSLDARKKDFIHFIYSVDVEVKNEKKTLRQTKDKDVSLASDEEYALPEGEISLENRPIVIGFGPSGMFAALVLAEKGLRPIVIERGRDVEARTKTVEDLFQNGKLDTESNIQFGEGGAGTFSDGKLTTRIKDLRCTKVLSEMAAAGAPDEILYLAKPHIGTDKLKNVVKNIREKIIGLGGEVLFNSKLTDIIVKDGAVCGVEINGEKTIATENLILAIGHSARDTFQLVFDKNIKMEQKAFAVGARIEHLQESINKAQFGNEWENAKLGAADYMMTCKANNGRGVYTFCMCPGGYVVAAASEENRVAVNGMSLYARDGENANSALLVQVFPEDFESEHPLAGIDFQRKLEEKAYAMGGGNYKAPVQRLGDFMDGKKTEAFGNVKNSYRPDVTFANLNDVFPEFISDAMKDGIKIFGRKLKGFDDKDAVLTAVESRSSSPVRIVREAQTGESVSVKGLYPSGEGAGYAGGIMSAAVDGIRAAEKILENNLKKI